jgi:hypothetical protein
MVLYEAAPGGLPLSGQAMTKKGDSRWEKKAERRIRTRLTNKNRSSKKRKRNNKRPSCPPKNHLSVGAVCQSTVPLQKFWMGDGDLPAPETNLEEKIP